MACVFIGGIVGIVVGALMIILILVIILAVGFYKNKTNKVSKHICCVISDPEFPTGFNGYWHSITGTAYNIHI